MYDYTVKSHNYSLNHDEKKVEKGIKLLATLHCDRQNEKLKFNQANEKNQLKRE